MLASQPWTLPVTSSYLIWLVPFIPVLAGPSGRAARVLFVTARAATAVEYLAIRQVSSFELWAILALNFRNALLVALFAVLLFGRGEIDDLVVAAPVRGLQAPSNLARIRQPFTDGLYSGSSSTNARCADRRLALPRPTIST